MSFSANRRTFSLSLLGSFLASAGMFGPASAALAREVRNSNRHRHFVVAGAGFGGATAIRTLRRWLPEARITLVEPSEEHVSCPFSNRVLAGLSPFSLLRHPLQPFVDSQKLAWRKAAVTALDPDKKRLLLSDGDSLSWDALILSPGVELRAERIPGWQPGLESRMPHAWKAGSATLDLQSRIRALPERPICVIAVPGEPFRCPPGPYERASLLAHWMQRHRPGGRIVILDAKSRFSKQSLFMSAWENLYPGIVEWRARDAGGNVVYVDAGKGEIHTEFGAEPADLINVIPPQSAPRWMQEAGLTGLDSRGQPGDWAEVSFPDFRSVYFPDIFVIGDAVAAGEMPKSGYSAFVQAEIMVSALLAPDGAKSLGSLPLNNVCYSFTAPDQAISVATVYRMEAGTEGPRAVPGAGGVSPLDAGLLFREQEASLARNWYRTMTRDIWGG